MYIKREGVSAGRESIALFRLNPRWSRRSERSMLYGGKVAFRIITSICVCVEKSVQFLEVSLTCSSFWHTRCMAYALRWYLFLGSIAWRLLYYKPMYLWNTWHFNIIVVGIVYSTTLIDAEINPLYTKTYTKFGIWSQRVVNGCGAYVHVLQATYNLRPINGVIIISNTDILEWASMIRLHVDQDLGNIIHTRQFVFETSHHHIHLWRYNKTI